MDLSAETLDPVVLTTGIMAGPKREVTAEGLERDVAISYLSRVAVLREIAPRHRVIHEVVQPHVEYSPTPLGRQAAERVRLLADWSENNLFAIIDARNARQAALAD